MALGGCITLWAGIFSRMDLDLLLVEEDVLARVLNEHLFGRDTLMRCELGSERLTAIDIVLLTLGEDSILAASRDVWYRRVCILLHTGSAWGELARTLCRLLQDRYASGA